MKKRLTFFLLVMFCWVALATAVWGAEEKSSGSGVAEFRAFSMFKSVKLVWQSSLPAATTKSFQITRSIDQKDGPYTSLATVEAKEGETEYSFTDKSISTSDIYYYKITVEGTGETFGPSGAKPFLSQPAT
jgi:hypothetical protein